MKPNIDVKDDAAMESGGKAKEEESLLGNLRLGLSQKQLLKLLLGGSRAITNHR